MALVTDRLKTLWSDKKTHVVLFSSTAIALYGYDQGMMSLINTNYSYLRTMGIAETSPLVGIIVSVYYLGCTAGAVLFSALADRRGRRISIFSALAITALGNAVMACSGAGLSHPGGGGALATMLVGRVVMGLGVGGIDSVIPTYSAELSSDDGRGRALAQEFQMNIAGLNIAFAVNLVATRALGKYSEWAWRVPIIVMQVFPLALLAVIGTLPESPRWLVYNGKEEGAKKALRRIYGDGDDDGDEGEVEGEAKKKFDELAESHKQDSGESVGYLDMFTPSHAQFHPTIITVMVQVNQALTGYGAVSVYGPQIFELLGFSVSTAEDLTMANYLSYFLLMTFAWLLIDAVGRRQLLLYGSAALTLCFLLLGLFGGLAMHCRALHIPRAAVAVPGVAALFTATGAFGVGWLATVWLVPTEIFPTVARAQAAAVSVIVWGLANFAVTLLTPIMFNNLTYFIFFVFAATNLAAGVWTWLYLPESGNRSFEDNVAFFEEAGKKGTWRVGKVDGGRWKSMPYNDVLLDGSAEAGEREPLLSRVGDQLP